MQREPVPPGLIWRQRLAAPFAIHPGKTRDLGRPVIDGDAAGDLELRLAEIIRRLSTLRFPAVAGIALQHQGTIRVETQRISEIRARRIKYTLRVGARRS